MAKATSKKGNTPAKKELINATSYAFLKNISIMLLLLALKQVDKGYGWTISNNMLTLPLQMLMAQQWA